MNKTSIHKLQYFVGKICTVFTKDIQRKFLGPTAERQFNDYFVGQIESVDEDGVMTVHITTNCKNYYLFENIVCISEEQFLDASNPDDAKLMTEMKQAKSPSDTSMLANIEFLAALQEKAEKD